MMDTEFGTYKNDAGVKRIRTLHYSIPENLHGYVSTNNHVEIGIII
jgi:hypothetical protein